jgi:predicted SAM-dependent methyltransferase
MPNKLNAGCGLIFLDGYINFDALKQEKNGKATDMVGDLRQLASFFPADHFDEILCSHVMEHFDWWDVPVVLKQFAWILAPGGKVIIECPCILGVYWLYVEREREQGKPPAVKNLATHLYGYENNHQLNGLYRQFGSHRSGWTADTMAEEVEKVGLKVVHKGIGLTHGMGRRDFRVEAVRAQ